MLLLTYIADAGKKEKCDFCKSIEKNFIEVSNREFLVCCGCDTSYIVSVHIQGCGP